MGAHTTPSEDGPIILRFPHSKEDLRRITIRDQEGQYEVYRLAPAISQWPAADVPDGVNPRSHRDEESLKNKIARDIEDTLRNSPQDFWLANRGGFLLAERVKFDPDRSVVEITLSDVGIHGLADGATTNAVIAKLQQEWQKYKDPELGESLSQARFNLDVVVGLTDRDRTMKLVEGRNRSIPVKEWSLADFKGQFDWLKDLIDRPTGPFKGKVGWEENSSAEVSVLDLISLMTLFHPIFDTPGERLRRAPTVAYTGKTTSDRRLADPKMDSGYKALKPVLEDILSLHDYVYANFRPAYEHYNKEVHNRGSKLGKLRGFEVKQTVLPLTGSVSDYRIDKGVLYPLLASSRALLKFSGKGANWRVEPTKFFHEYGGELVGLLLEQYELCDKNPAKLGKTRSVYSTLHDRARLLLAERQAGDTA